MTGRGAILASVAAAVVLAAGGVVASALDDLPQDARPVQDTTADLNRQAAPPTPNTVPAEPAPEGDPAPPAPIAITPPVTPPIVIATEDLGDEADEEAEDEKAEEKAEPRVETPATPGRRQRRRVAIVEAVNKITAESMRFAVEVGGRPVMFQRTLIVSARACEVSASDEQVGDSIAYLEFNIRPRGVLQVTEPRQIFRGWMFASSPAVNGLEHPIYDAWVVGCRA